MSWFFYLTFFILHFDIFILFSFLYILIFSSCVLLFTSWYFHLAFFYLRLDIFILPSYGYSFYGSGFYSWCTCISLLLFVEFVVQAYMTLASVSHYYYLLDLLCNMIMVVVCFSADSFYEDLVRRITFYVVYRIGRRFYV